MTMTEADVFCPACQAYVHAFLERCPACGAARKPRLDEAAADPRLGLEALAADPVLRRKLTHLIDGYALTAPRLDLPHKTGFGDAPRPDFTIGEATAMLVALLVFRGYGCPPRPSEPAEVRLALTAEELEVREAKSHERIVGIPLSGILSIAAPASGGLPRWAGIQFGGATAMRTPAIPVGSFLVTYAADGSFDQLSVQNRPGMFSSKARPDYYTNIRRWVGLTTAEAAERRWSAIGLDRYLAEIGLGPAAVAERPAPAGAAPPEEAAGPAMAMAPATRPSTRAALEELDDLRSAGLVTDDEYRRKRQEILDRL